MLVAYKAHSVKPKPFRPVKKNCYAGWSLLPTPLARRVLQKRQSRVSTVTCVFSSGEVCNGCRCYRYSYLVTALCVRGLFPSLKLHALYIILFSVLCHISFSADLLTSRGLLPLPDRSSFKTRCNFVVHPSASQPYHHVGIELPIRRHKLQWLTFKFKSKRCLLDYSTQRVSWSSTGRKTKEDCLYNMSQEEIEMRWEQTKLCDLRSVVSPLLLRRGQEEEWTEARLCKRAGG